MRIIGITGGVGAGKSEILHFIADTFAAAGGSGSGGISGDAARAEAFDPIVELFGKEILTETEGWTGRRYPGEFSGQRTSGRLNAIVHPAVKAYIRRAMEKERQAGPVFHSGGGAFAGR